MSIKHHISLSRTAMSTLLATILSSSIIGCSGGGGSTSTTTIDGSVFASSVNGATCAIYSGPDEMIGSSFTTSEDGTFSVNIADGKLASDLALVCSGGTYTDEVDGSTQTAEFLAAYVEGGTLGADTSFNATPGSTIVFQLITEYDMTLAQAETAFELAFGYVPDVTIAPTDVTNPASGSSLGAIEAGLRAAAFSQFTSDLGLGQGQQFNLLSALTDDLSDGTADGVTIPGAGVVTIPGTSTNLPVTIAKNFDAAMNNFRLRTALSSSYKFTYTSQMMMGDKEGKNNFQINITDHDNFAVEGLTVTVMPMMYMESKTHSTPVDGACTDVGSGNYNCTVYYVMASRMMGDMSMGEWDLKVMAGGEAVHFYPEVGMAMGDTAMAKLKNSNLTMTMMEVTSARTFQIFKSSLTGWAGNHTFELFTATMETMMSFPAVDNGVTLNAGTMNELAISGMSVEVSTTSDFDTTYTASEDDNGYWTAAGITGLADDSTETLYVRVTINGNVLNSSIDGVYVDEATTPDYGTFTVTTPPGSV